MLPNTTGICLVKWLQYLFYCAVAFLILNWLSIATFRGKPLVCVYLHLCSYVYAFLRDLCIFLFEICHDRLQSCSGTRTFRLMSLKFILNLIALGIILYLFAGLNPITQKNLDFQSQKMPLFQRTERRGSLFAMTGIWIQVYLELSKTFWVLPKEKIVTQFAWTKGW